MTIPIENIYYLLCYAWNKLDEKDRVAVRAEDYTELLDLLAKVLINATRILLKRGIDRNYVEVTQEFPGIKGKLEISRTLKSNLLLKQKTVCTFDEFSSNILTNRILITTLHRLLRTKNLDKDLKSEIKNLLWRFDDVEPIELNSVAFDKIKLHRNNRFYGFILKVCRLIYESSFPSEESGTFEFADFIRDEHKMRYLFEAFLRNFYTLEQTEYRVKGETIRWQFSAENESDLKFLPIMRTDITLENDRSKIIIDAKFYKQTLSKHFEKESISSANLYQIFSYLLNQQQPDAKTQSTTGILIYPTVEQDYDLRFRFQNHKIIIATVNLNNYWMNIENRLKTLINLYDSDIS
jgi:5-methylcytosine-specific restriction enzyme subunit McrC